MPHPPVDDPILQRFKGALGELYGDQIDRVVLFGSRARGEALSEADYDIAVFLTSLADRWKERKRLADLRLRFLDSNGIFIDAQPFAKEAYDERTPIMYEIRRDGIDL